MLILTRNVGESIIIGSESEKIVITLLSTRGAQAKIGVHAPPTIIVHREEIYKKIKKQTISSLPAT